MSALSEVRTGYNVREGATMLAARVAPELEPAVIGAICDCGETMYRGRCYNVGACRDAERSAVRGSLVRGTAASVRPSAWTIGGRVD